MSGTTGITVAVVTIDELYIWLCDNCVTACHVRMRMHLLLATVWPIVIRGADSPILGRLCAHMCRVVCRPVVEDAEFCALDAEYASL